MKLSIVTAFLASCGAASAFAPSTNMATRTASSSALQMADKNADDMSKALPFAPRPKILDGALPGDVGFDPFGFAGADKESLINMREAEIKHARLAMLAVVGWPLAELWDQKIASFFGLESALTSTGSSPSLLNGGLDKIEPEYWLIVGAIAAWFELDSKETKEKKGKDYAPGDCGFDPLNLFPEDKAGQFEMQVKEIKHGRIAMMALLGFVVQEALYRTPVTAETPFFFQPIF
uniref:Plastid light harvesting protein n=1 Tax=Helicotheca tamesis TaxID=374047 RepID=A0A7S2HHN0_9STRA|mmetsp:Transcript_18178/g.25013  ORF Transcript_18178/g.25013 Transcript_18178/m.25013 type:complete len:234 (+) Transcript_18178:69-770(+)|eukprot:CAMPEP_0185728222 /NCGR_PEP_ID=MMETSP1171-20130828/3642_1 /TAXON_ID=374046 /ORGANISM="Helicotheca tamensis, Strain CCMP826" /LENGTH=233 /DNA_ID=CAMNT_0028396905 /DNA_START=50 /DNA_END=751 /DNA_ORIENTATION=+